jgi:hypothetical protein
LVHLCADRAINLLDQELITELIDFPSPEHIDSFRPDFSIFTANNLNFFKLGYLKLSSPPRAWEDMKIISAVFAGSVIREGFGKF